MHFIKVPATIAIEEKRVTKNDNLATTMIVAVLEQWRKWHVVTNVMGTKMGHW
jgi:hypothetical protein